MLADSTPVPTVVAINSAMEITISYHAGVDIAIRANIAMGAVNGMNEHTFSSVLSALPEDIEVITMRNPTMKIRSTGMIEADTSSRRETSEPIAPNMNAYREKPSRKTAARSRRWAAAY